MSELLGETAPSLIIRIAVGKAIGFGIGLLAFFFVRVMVPELGSLFPWAILFWYVTLGAIVAVFGVFTYHPILQLPMPWWFRAPLIGGWMNFVLTFFIYDKLEIFIVNILGSMFGTVSPFWFVLEGALVGLLIGYFATRFGGEGRGVVQNQS
jgi:hypothetical protein